VTEKRETRLAAKLGFPIAIAIFAFMWFVPLEGMDELTRKTLGLMLFTVVLWITRPIFPALTALLFMIIAWGLELTIFKTAFSGFTNTTAWFVWGALVIAFAIKETRLDLRFARFLATKTPASTKGVLGSYYVLSFLLTYIMPSTTARVASTAPIAAAQIETLDVPLKSRAGKMLMTSLVTWNSYNGALLLSGGSTIVTAWGILSGLGMSITWAQWWLYLIGPGLVAMVVNFIVNLLIFRPEPAKVADGAGVRKIAKAELAKLGPMTAREKRLAAILAITIILWATESFHGIETAFICCMCGITLCMPGIGVLDAKRAMSGIGWDSVVFVAAALSIGTVTEATGVADIIKQILSYILTFGESEFLFLLMMLVLGFIGRLVLRNGSANVAVLLAPAILLAQSLGYNPLYVGLFFALSLGGIFMYQNTPSMIAYDYGTFEEPDFMLASLARYAGLIALITFAYFIWWPLLGV